MVAATLCKLKEYHIVCIKLKKLKKIDIKSSKYLQQVEQLLPEVKNKYTLVSHAIPKKLFYKKQVETYFLQNVNKCEMYFSLRDKFKKT